MKFLCIECGTEFRQGQSACAGCGRSIGFELDSALSEWDSAEPGRLLEAVLVKDKGGLSIAPTKTLRGRLVTLAGTATPSSDRLVGHRWFFEVLGEDAGRQILRPLGPVQDRDPRGKSGRHEQSTEKKPKKKRYGGRAGFGVGGVRGTRVRFWTGRP